MRAVAEAGDVTDTTNRAECLDGPQLSAEHPHASTGVHRWQGLPCMDPVWCYGVPCEILDGLHGEHCAVGPMHLTGLHDLADAAPYLGYEGVRPRATDALVRCVLHCLHELVVHGVETKAKGAIQDVALNLHAKVHLQDVVWLQPSAGVTGIDCVVCCHLIQRETGWESPAPSKGLLGVKPDSHSCALLDHLCQPPELQARPHLLLKILPDLAVNLGAFAEALQPLSPGVVLHCTARQLLPSRAPAVP
mmetsp:Transcript_53735/g.149053  ORF Transcript_53735/g.149053 Transcript_53735/m.149053 type:complete len:248 (-) Transcript_53735:345-1088(-)